ncbi:ferredoxin reductase family protein [Streptacidiphilus sp. PAMC 29251]
MTAPRTRTRQAAPRAAQGRAQRSGNLPRGGTRGSGPQQSGLQRSGPRRSGPRRLPARGRPLAVDLLAVATGLGLGISLALGITGQSAHDLTLPGGLMTAIGRVTGMLAGYAMIVTVLLSARIPPLERTLGQDRLTAWHRRLAPWGLYLIVAHAVFITLGYARAAKTGLLAQIWQLLWTYSGVLSATVGTALLVMAGVTSYRRARRKLAYETWWAIHLYTYLGLGLSFIHQVDTGTPFIVHPLARTWWYTLWLGTLALVIAFRIVLPLYRSWRHDLRIAKITPAGPHTWAITMTGRDLKSLPAAGGQFMMWRFLRRGLWWQAHPYSLSAAPTAGQLRITVKELGDHSTALSRLAPGTRVAFEGPYGVFTADTRATTTRDVLLIGAGVGTTPVRALLDELPPDVHAVVLLRGRTHADIAHLDEFTRILARRPGRLHPLTGPRQEIRMDAAALLSLVPDIARRDLYVCGPDAFTRGVIEAAGKAGVPPKQINYEDFSF